MIELAHAYNEETNTKPIKLKTKLDTLNPTKYKRYLVREFGKRLDKLCDNQSCWLRQSFVNKIKESARKRIKTSYHRPPGPQKQFEWLNTINIEKVMNQYSNKYPEFIFMGAVPIDFDSLPLPISSMDLGQLENEGIHKIGVIFNIDEHWQPGSHWVASYFDIKDGQVYFFDSYGERPDPRIRKLMRRVTNYINQKGGKTIDVRHNNIRHQYKGSECGVYSINFIERLLEGDSFDKIINDRTDDNTINKFRNRYFYNVNI